MFREFLMLHQEAGLVAVLLALFIYDLFAEGGAKKWLRHIAIGLFGALTVAGFVVPLQTGEAFGGMFAATDMTILMKNILNLATLFVFMQAAGWLRSDKSAAKREGEFYIITLATLLGMYMMISAGNFMLLYVGIEMASIPLACLAAYDKYKHKSAEAGAKYILFSAMATGVMLFGISYLYGAFGTMYFDDMREVMVASPVALLGLVFFLAGLGFKISLVPFHLWTADVYEGAPTSVTAYLSVVSKAASCFVLVFVLYRVFGQMADVWYYILWGLSVVTIVVGNLFAIRQKDIKRFFAFSSISQAGYILLGVIAGTEQGMTATVYYIIVYLFSNLAAFGVISSVERHSGRTSIASYKGLYKSNPKLAFVMMIALFSLAGIPPFAGFFSKFFIFAAVAAEGEYLLVFIALLNTVISLYYYLLIVKAMFIDQAGDESVGPIRTDGYNRISLAACSAGIIVVGLLSCIYLYVGNLSWGII